MLTCSYVCSCFRFFTAKVFTHKFGSSVFASWGSTERSMRQWVHVKFHQTKYKMLFLIANLFRHNPPPKPPDSMYHIFFLNADFTMSHVYVPFFSSFWLCKWLCTELWYFFSLGPTMIHPLHQMALCSKILLSCIFVSFALFWPFLLCVDVFCAFYVFMKSKELVDEGADAIFYFFLCGGLLLATCVCAQHMTSSSVLLKFLRPSTPPQKNSGAFKVPPWQH